MQTIILFIDMNWFSCPKYYFSEKVIMLLENRFKHSILQNVYKILQINKYA